MHLVIWYALRGGFRGGNTYPPNPHHRTHGLYVPIPVGTGLQTYAILEEVVTNYLKQFKREFQETVVIDGLTFSMNFSLTFQAYTLVPREYNGIPFQEAEDRHRRSELPFSKVLDSLPLLSPYKEFSL